VPFESHDLSGLSGHDRTEAIQRVCTELQGSFDLGQGLLLRVAHFGCGPGEPDRLFVTIHHFAVDGMSWGVFWEDLEQAYRQVLAGEAVSLPPKTTSFRTWAAQLEQLAHSARVVDTAEGWLRLPWEAVAPLPLDGIEASSRRNTNASADMMALELGPELTRRLLDSRWRPEHVIMTALARTLSTWSASPTVLIDVLSHGRDAVLDGVNLSRTVAFTLSYNPIVLRHPTWVGSPELLDDVTRQIAASPEGFSFDLLRYLAPDEALRGRFMALPRAELLFNYAGLESGREDDELWQAATEPSGPEEAPDGLRQYPIAVRATVAPDLRLAFVYSRELHTAATIEARVAEVEAALRGLLEGVEVAP
jgi:non-ribosomal peptide synthase protein (TIGR01720 family)